MVTVTVSGYSVTERFKFRRDSECVTASGSPRLGGHDSDVQAAAARTLSLTASDSAGVKLLISAKLPDSDMARSPGGGPAAAGGPGKPLLPGGHCHRDGPTGMP